MNTMLISEVAERTGFPATTLRYYEDIGLLPQPVRNGAGYRVYSDADIEALRFIDRGKRLGLSLEDITDILALWRDGDCGRTRDQVETLLHAKLRQVHRELAELAAFEGQLTDAYERVTSVAAPQVCGPDCGCPPSVATSVTSADRLLPLHDGGVSCSLDGDQLQEQADQWQRLMTESLRSRQPRADGSIILRFTGDDRTEARVRDLAQREQGCCDFFELEVTRTRSRVVLRAAAPATHADYLDLLFDAPVETPR